MSMLTGGLGSPYAITSGLSTGAAAIPEPLAIDAATLILLSTPPPVYRPPALSITAGDYLILCQSYVNPVVLPISFVAAVRAALVADSVLSGLVRGGWWHRKIPRGQPLPVAMYRVLNPVDQGVGGPHFIQTGRFELNVYSRVAQTSRIIADRAAEILSDSPMAWATGRLMMLRAAQPSSPAPPMPGYAASDVFAETRTFEYMLSGRYDHQ